MIMNKTICFLILSPVLISCELTKEINYDTINSEDKIVIHGFINKTDGVNVIVKKSVPPDNVDADDRLANVDINLFEDGVKIQSLVSLNDYLFSSATSFIPKQESSYYIEVVSQHLPDVISTPQDIFLPVKIDTLYLKIDELTYYANLMVSFNNNLQPDKSYYLKVLYYLDGNIDSSRIESEIFNPFGLIDNLNYGVNTIEKQIGHISEFDSLRVMLFTLSPDLTEFLKSFQKYESSKEDPFFEQTYPVYSNIQRGHGIFASYSYTTRIIRK